MNKKILAFILASIFFVPLLSFAQTSQSSLAIPAVAVRNIKTSQVSFTAGDTVNGTFALINAGKSDASDIYYQISLVGDYQGNTLAGTFYDSTKLTGPTYVAAGKNVTVQFAYKLPVAVSGTGLGIQIQAFTGTGLPLGWSDQKITVQENKNATGPGYLSVDSAVLMLGKTSFNLQDGPTVHENEIPKLKITLASLPKTNMDVVAGIDLYDRNVIGAPIMSATSPVITLGPSSDKTFLIQLPLPFTSKVYVAQVSLKTVQGVRVFSPLDVRYIIQGNIVTIQSLSVDKDVVKAGEVINTTIQYTGAPADIRTKTVVGQENGVINVALYNERNELVGQSQDAIDLKALGSIGTLAVTAAVPSKALRGEVTVTKGGAVIARYSTKLSAQYDTERDLALSAAQEINPMFLLSIAILVVMCFIFFMLTKKYPKNRRGSGSKTKIVILALAILWAGSASATNWTNSLKGVSVYYNSPISGSSETTGTFDLGSVTMTPGQPFWLSGSIFAPACRNAGQNVTFEIIFNGTVYKGDYYKNKTARGGSTDNGEKWGDYMYQFSYGSAAAKPPVPMGPLTIPGVPEQPFFAPTTPGTYVMKVYINVVTGLDTGTANEKIYHNITIVVPSPEPVVSSCTVKPTSGPVGTIFTWSAANPTGGNGVYTYSWSGTDGLAGTSQDVNKAYSSAGTKTGSVTVTSNGVSTKFDCSNSATVSNTPLSATCSVTPETGPVGTLFHWSAVPTGGNGVYTYSWSGTGVSGAGNVRSFDRSYPLAGTYGGSVTVISNGVSQTFACTNSATVTNVSSFSCGLGVPSWGIKCPGTSETPLVPTDWGFVGPTSGSCNSRACIYYGAQPLPGLCGTANKIYPNGSISYGADTFCASGSPTPTAPAFPSAGNSVAWTCSGTGGASAANCSAGQSAGSSGGPAACRPMVKNSSGALVDATFANVGQLVYWHVTSGLPPYTWGGDKDGGSFVSPNYQIRYYTIGNKTVTLKVGSDAPVPCTIGMTSGTQLQIINDPNFHEF